MIKKLSENTMEKFEYMWKTVLCSGFMMLFYYSLFFRCLKGQTLIVSRFVLLGLLLLFTVPCVLMTIHTCRNHLNVFVNAFFPYEVYTIISYWDNMTVFSTVILILSILLPAAFLLLVLLPKIKNRVKKRLIIRKRIAYGARGARAIAALCLILFSISVIPGGSILKVAAEVPSDSKEWTIENNIDILVNFHSNIRWKKLSFKEKADTLQIVANIEATYLGLPHELNVKIGECDENVISAYDDTLHTITVSRFFLDSEEAEADDFLDGILHEAMHAFQYRLCDAYSSADESCRNLIIFANVPAYIEEFNAYIDGNADLYGYAFQACEKDARHYSLERANAYYYAIDDYCQGGAANVTP